MSQTENYAKARRRAEAKYYLLVHAAIYCAVMVLLIVINLLTSPGVWWFIWPLLGWGVAVVLHFLGVVLMPDSNVVIDKLTARELRRQSKADQHR